MTSLQVYYNDSEPFVCDWLENLIRENLLPAGVVDRRPIQEVEPNDVRDFAQCHFFAGIGGWAYALQLAHWGDRPVWTGSCPCQPFSAAGARKSHADDRHLWPAWCRLIRECHPDTIFGEQVSGAAGLGWLDAVALDLEAADYAVGACVLGAHSVGAPHLRQRLYFVGENTQCDGWRGGRDGGTPRDDGEVQAPGLRGASELGNAELHGLSPLGQSGGAKKEGRMRQPEGSGAPGELADRNGGRREQRDPEKLSVQITDAHSAVDDVADPECRPPERRGHDLGNAPEGPASEAPEWERVRLDAWASCEFIPCRDGKARPVEPGTFPLAHGVPARVGRLRAYGNSIVPACGAAFVKAYLEATEG